MVRYEVALSDYCRHWNGADRTAGRRARHQDSCHGMAVTEPLSGRQRWRRQGENSGKTAAATHRVGAPEWIEQHTLKHRIQWANRTTALAN